MQKGVLTMEQTKPFTLINQAVMSYGLDFQSLEIEPVSFHNLRQTRRFTLQNPGR